MVSTAKLLLGLLPGQNICNSCLCEVYVVSTQTFSPHKPFLGTWFSLLCKGYIIIIYDNYNKWCQLAVFYLWVVGESYLKIIIILKFSHYFGFRYFVIVDFIVAKQKRKKVSGA